MMSLDFEGTQNGGSHEDGRRGWRLALVLCWQSSLLAQSLL